MSLAEIARCFTLLETTCKLPVINFKKNKISYKTPFVKLGTEKYYCENSCMFGEHKSKCNKACHLVRRSKINRIDNIEKNADCKNCRQKKEDNIKKSKWLKPLQKVYEEKYKKLLEENKDIKGVIDKKHNPKIRKLIRKLINNRLEINVKHIYNRLYPQIFEEYDKYRNVSAPLWLIIIYIICVVLVFIAVYFGLIKSGAYKNIYFLQWLLRR